MIGFVQTVHGNGSMKTHKSQCFYGNQIEHKEVEKSVEEQNGEGVKIDRIVSKGGSAVQVEAKTDEAATP